jgi:hypothetical protein
MLRGHDGRQEIVEIDSRELRDLDPDAGLSPVRLRSPAFLQGLEHRIRVERDDWDGQLKDVRVLYIDDNLAHSWLKREGRIVEGAEASDERDDTLRQISRCRGLLRLANLALPRSVREDALDEWMDEIHCAAEEGLPLRHRALSILFRSLPALALRARFPVRARRGEG